MYLQLNRLYDNKIFFRRLSWGWDGDLQFEDSVISNTDSQISEIREKVSILFPNLKFKIFYEIDKNITLRSFDIFYYVKIEFTDKTQEIFYKLKYS